MTSCKSCGSLDEVTDVGRWGPGPKAAVTWTFGSVQAVCMECLGKAVRLDSKRKENGKINESQPALDSNSHTDSDPPRPGSKVGEEET